jgi:hypothetical protein
MRAKSILVAAGVVAFTYVWMTVHRFAVGPLSSLSVSQLWERMLGHWIDRGYFGSFGLIVPTADANVVYRFSSGGVLITSYIIEKIWIAMTGHYGWRLLALHNSLFGLLTAILFGVLAYRIALRLDLKPLHALILGICAEMVHLTFPEHLGMFYEVTTPAWFLAAALVFLLIEERAMDGWRKRLALMQGIAVFAMTYLEVICGTLFLIAYLFATFILRDERPPFKRVVVPWLAALALFAMQLTLAKVAGLHAMGSPFLYRTGLDGDITLYRTPLDIAFGRDIVRRFRPGNHQDLFHWPVLFFCGAFAVLATFLAYMRRHIPRTVLIALVSLLGTYAIYASVFSQAVALAPYMFDTLLVTPLILALFAIIPALADTFTNRTGAIVVVVAFAALWTSMYQLRMYALAYVVR